MTKKSTTKTDATPKKFKAAKKESKSKKSFEQTLYDAADKPRGAVEPSEYKHVVLSLIFLKFVSDRFEIRCVELDAEGKATTST